MALAISFIPLPVHLLLVVLAAIWWRLNVAVAIAGTYVVNPFTMVPVYYSPTASARRCCATGRTISSST